MIRQLAAEALVVLLAALIGVVVDALVRAFRRGGLSVAGSTS